MKAQTYLDVARGLDLINTRIWNALHREEDKADLATEAGACVLLNEIETVTETLREVIRFDTGVPSDARALTA